MSFIRPLPSLYRGILFRSRNEARYATYFDRLGIAWEYERQAFALPAGNYLPDFLLPNPPSGKPCWVEIKGPAPTGLEHVLARELASATGYEVVLFDGPPLTGHNQGKSWGPDGSFSEPACLTQDDVASTAAGQFAGNVRWDRGGEAELPESSPPPQFTTTNPIVTDDDVRRLRARNRRCEHEGLIASALFKPELFDRVRADLHPDEIGDEGIATLWREMRLMKDAGDIVDVKSLAHRVSGDAAASCALAGLPDDLQFDIWLSDVLRHRASVRTHEARRQAVLQVFCPHLANPRGAHGPR